MDRLDWTKIDCLQLSDVLYWSVGRQCTNIVTPQLALKREVRFCIILLNEWKYNMKMPNKTIELNNTRQEITDKIAGTGWKCKKKQRQKQLESHQRIQTFTKEPSHACREADKRPLELFHSDTVQYDSWSHFFAAELRLSPNPDECSLCQGSQTSDTTPTTANDKPTAISDLSGDYHG